MKMANRFQEALDSLNELVASTNSLGNCWDIELLQELIDNYSKLKQKNIELEIKREKTQILFEEATSRLLKALDKACYNYVLEKLNYKVSKETCTKLAQEEKERLLKESGKQ